MFLATFFITDTWIYMCKEISLPEISLPALTKTEYVLEISLAI